MKLNLKLFQSATPALSPEDRLYRRRRFFWLSLGVFGSLLFHLLVAYIMAGIPLKEIRVKQQVPVRLEFKTREPDAKKKESQPKKEEEARRQIIEAPLPPTAPPEKPARLGAQDHRTQFEQKTQPRQGAPGADASAIQNGMLRLEQEEPKSESSEAPEKDGGRIELPRRKPRAERYASLLPQRLEVMNPGHNDYIPDKDIPVGPVLDVNTTDFRFIGYFTAVRKQVDLAYYDVGPTLRDSPHVRERLEESGKVRFQGVSLVELKVMRSGVLVETRLARSSGDKEIDDFWMRILNLAAPYPPLPRDYPGDELVFTYALYYDLAYENSRPMTRFMF